MPVAKGDAAPAPAMSWKSVKLDAASMAAAVIVRDVPRVSLVMKRRFIMLLPRYLKVPEQFIGPPMVIVEAFATPIKLKFVQDIPLASRVKVTVLVKLTMFIALPAKTGPTLPADPLIFKVAGAVNVSPTPVPMCQEFPLPVMLNVEPVKSNTLVLLLLENINCNAMVLVLAVMFPLVGVMRFELVRLSANVQAPPTPSKVKPQAMLTELVVIVLPADVALKVTVPE